MSKGGWLCWSQRQKGGGYVGPNVKKGWVCWRQPIAWKHRWSKRLHVVETGPHYVSKAARMVNTRGRLNTCPLGLPYPRANSSWRNTSSCSKKGSFWIKRGGRFWSQVLPGMFCATPWTGKACGTGVRRPRWRSWRERWRKGRAPTVASSCPGSRGWRWRGTSWYWVLMPKSGTTWQSLFNMLSWIRNGQ